MSVDPATNKMSAAEIEQVRQKASAEKIVVQQVAAQTKEIEAEVFSKDSQPSSSSSSSGSSISGGKSTEAGFVLGVAADALLGTGAVSAVIEGLDTRYTDKAGMRLSTPIAGKTDGIIGQSARTVEDMIGETNRAPGHYEAVSNVFKNRRIDGEDILMRSNIARSSLKDQEPQNLSTWNCPQKAAKLSFVTQLKQENVLTREIASRQALDSVNPALNNYSAATLRAQKLGMGFGSGPSIRTDDLINGAKKINEDQSSWGTA